MLSKPPEHGKQSAHGLLIECKCHAADMLFNAFLISIVTLAAVQSTLAAAVNFYL